MKRRLKETAKDSGIMKRKQFLASVGHEIRTPMSAIIGLSNILLRQANDPVEKEYLSDMETATNNLLLTINNILDYEDIVDGHVKVEPSQFNLLELITEVSNISKINLGPTKVKFILDVDPTIPKVIVSDASRIKQVLVHLLSNAEKFTKEGYISLIIKRDDSDKDSKIIFSVEDTGRGMSKEEIVNFLNPNKNEEHEKVESSLNPEIGLNLAKSIVEAMGSHLECTSERGIGTTVSFTLPVEIMEESENTACPGYFHIAVYLLDKKRQEATIKMLESLNISCISLSSMGETFVAHGKKKISHIVLDYDKYIQIKEVSELNELGISYIVLIDSIKQAAGAPNTVYARKPFWFKEAVKVFRGEGIRGNEKKKEFIETLYAPKAKILLVDDNAINLKVTKGLLLPFGASVDSVTSAEEGIKLIKKNRYDIVFMDHMMAGMDGVEATKAIREIDNPYFKSLPIIALTANTIEGIDKTFELAGMNDFVPKPVDAITLENTLRKWLPADLVESGLIEVAPVKTEEEIFRSFSVIDTSVGLGYSNSDSQMYKEIIKEFAEDIVEKKDLLDNLIEKDDVGRFTIEVHGVKSSAKTVGAMRLSEKALELERLGHMRDIEGIKSRLNALDAEMELVIEDLQPFISKETVGKTRIPIDRDRVREILRQVFYAVSEYDYDKTKDLISELSIYRFEGTLGKIFSKMSESLSDIDYEETRQGALELLAHI